MQDEEKRALGPELRRQHGWPELRFQLSSGQHRHKKKRMRLFLTKEAVAFVFFVRVTKNQ